MAGSTAPGVPASTLRPDGASAAALPRSLRSQRALARSRAALGGALLAALTLRVWLNVRSNWLIDGDEALFGIAAQRILHGAHPVFLYGVPYMGMLQSYVAAPFVALFGPRDVSLRLVTLLGSLAYVGLTWQLARVWYDPLTAALAAWIAAFPSVYFAATALKVWGAYVGVMALGSFLLLGAWRCRERPGLLPRRAWLFLGFATGLALWANFLVSYYLVTAALLLPWRRAGRWLPAALLFGLPGVLVGGFPLWAYNLRHGGATFRFLLGGVGGADPQFGAVARVLWYTLLPRVSGLTSPWGEAPLPARLVLAGMLAAAFLLALVDSARALRSRQGRSSATAPAWPVLLFLGVSLATYLLSGFGRPSLSPFDASGRYLLPIWTALPILLGALCARLGRGWLPLGALALALILAANLAGDLASQPGLVFQSPYWTRLPEDDGPLLGWLEGQGVTAVWMNHWAGNQLIYHSGGAIAAADYYDIAVGHGLNRLPDLFAQVETAPRPAFVVVAPGEALPPLEHRLQQLGVLYVHASFGPYQAYLPTSRRVAPAEVVDALRYPY